METTERAKRKKVRVVSMRPGSGPGPNLSGKRIILTNVTTARNRAKIAMRALVVITQRRSSAFVECPPSAPLVVPLAVDRR